MAGNRDIISNLIAKDQMSGPLRKIATEAGNVDDALEATGKSASTAGTQVEKAGTQGAAGIGKLGDAADQSRSRIDAMNVGLTVLGAGLTKAGDLSRREEQQVIGLTRAFGDAADEMLDFAQTLDDMTMFSDDDIRGGERFFATLRNNYDLSIDQIKQLMEVTADLASASGVSFEDASNRVTAAIRGEGEAAEYLGLTMNQQSIDRGNLTLTMTNQEAAQFRLNALMDQSAVYQGTANDMMQTSSGILAEWSDTASDAGASIGRFVGPLATMATGLGTAALGMAGLGLNANVLGRGLTAAATGARTFLGAIGPVGWAVLGVSVAIPVLSKLFGDSGDAMDGNAESAEALATSLASLDDMIKQTQLSGDFWLAGTFREWDQQAEDAIAGLEQQVGDLWTGLDSIIQDGDLQSGQSKTAFVDWILATFGPDALEQAGADGVIAQSIVDTINAGQAEALQGIDLRELEEFAEMQIEALVPDAEDQKLIADAMKPIWDLMTQPNVDQAELAADYQKIWDAFEDHDSVSQLIADLEALEQQTIETARAASLVDAPDYYRMMGQEQLGDMILKFNLLRSEVDEVNAALSTGELRAYNEAWDGINEAVEEGSFYADHMNLQIATLTSQLKSGAISEREYAQGIVDIYLQLPEWEANQEKVTAAIDLTTASMTAWLNGLGETTAEQDRLNSALSDFESVMAGVDQLLDSAVTNAVDLALAMRDVRDGAFGIGQAANAGITSFVKDMQLLEETLSGILELTGNGDFLSQWNMSGFASEASLAAEAINDLAVGLDTTYRVIVGNTNAIASQVDGIHSWAEELINVEGIYGEIDRLLANGLITQEQYNNAQLAYNDIAAANVQIQEDVLAIQAQQAPLIASQTTAMADYVEQIRLMNDGTVEGQTRQLEALAWMDSGLQNSAMNVAMFADQLDDLGPSGEAAFSQMVDSIAATNPALFTMLETMGYVSDVVRDEDGKVLSYDVNINGADGAMSEIERLTLSIDALTLALGGVPPQVDVDINADTADAEDGITRTTRAAQDFDGTTSTGILDANGQPAIGTIGVVDESLGAINGKTSTVNVVANDQASGALANIAANWGGVIATSFIDIVTRNVPGNALGGAVQAYARGGVLTELAEAGPEILHFASGGTAYIGQRGIYAVEPGTYVSPNNAVGNTSYGGDIHVHLNGPVFGMSDLADQVSQELVPVISDVFAERMRGMGV